MKKRIKWRLLFVSMALSLTACNEQVDNPVGPSPSVNPETPEQIAFWQQFDSWQTDSCTLSDDFYMHFLGNWWNNPTDVYPDGLINYAGQLNDQHVKAVWRSNPDLEHLIKSLYDSEPVGEEDLQAIIETRVEELWDGAETYEEALAALGRAWAEGYTLYFEPIVGLPEGKPVWQMSPKLPSYFSIADLTKTQEERWQLLAQRKGKKLSELQPRRIRRTLPDGTQIAPWEIIVEAMDLGVGADEVEWVDDNTFESFRLLLFALSTPEDIHQFITQSVTLLDGALVSEELLAQYAQEINNMIYGSDNDDEAEEKENGGIYLTMDGLKNNVLNYMGNLYTLHAYNQQFITPQMKRQYAGWCEQFRNVMRQRLQANEWLEDETRENALQKLEAIVFNIGEPVEIPACVLPPLTGDNIIEDVQMLRRARMDGYRWAATQTRQNTIWLLSCLRYIDNYTIDNAYYTPSSNAVFINPSNLLYPYVDESYEPALQWAFIGTTIGHELTHAFDSSGSQYDLYGVYRDWWTEADAAKFQSFCQQLIDQYDNLQLMPWVDPTLMGDGEKTLGENMADLGGCCIALQILMQEYEGATPEQQKALARRYFQGWAIQWSQTYDLEFLKMRKENDVHSQARERTNGVVRNIDAWYDAYDINDGKLYLAPSQRARIW